MAKSDSDRFFIDKQISDLNIDVLTITSIRYHDLRHTFATLALEQNVPLKVVSHLLGHSNIAVTANTYSHVLEPIARQHSESIATLIF